MVDNYEAKVYLTLLINWCSLFNLMLIYMGNHHLSPNKNSYHEPQGGGSIGQSWGLLGNNFYGVISSNLIGCYLPLGASHLDIASDSNA
jgi:hypothetical protein